MDAATAALLGAAISGVVALGGQVVGGWLAYSRQRGQSRNERLGRFMASAQGYIMAVGQVARSQEGRKDELEQELIWTYMDSVDMALAEIKLHDPRQVVEAAVDLDRALGELIGEARKKQFSREDWRTVRDPITKGKMERFNEAARAAMKKVFQ